MQIMQYYTEHAKQVNNMHLSTVLRKISILFRGGKVIQILFLTVQKQRFLVILTPEMPKHHQVEKKLK